jgi:Uma2 family endonuclease
MRLKVAKGRSALRHDSLHRLAPPRNAFRTLRLALEQIERRADDIDLRTRSDPRLEDLDPLDIGLLQHEGFTHRSAPYESPNISNDILTIPSALKQRYSTSGAASRRPRCPGDPLRAIVLPVHEAQRHYSLDEYFVVEENSAVKHEFFNGEIFAMAGASVAHNHISGNLLALLRTNLRETTCNAFGSDLRIGSPAGLFTYPDVSVICGRVDLVPDRPDTATNPVLLFEVLSDATRDYDRGEKFELYKAIPSLQEYVLIEQGEVFIQHFRRSESGRWSETALTSLAETLHLPSIATEIAVAEVYREVFAAPD